MPNPLLELIERTERTLTGIRSDIKNTTDKAMKDGKIDDGEAREIQDLNGKLARAEKLLKDRKAEFQAEKAAWEAQAAALKTILADVVTLKAWGEPKLADVEKKLTEMSAAATDQRYKDACASLAAAQEANAPLMVEYKRQSEAKKTYDDERATLETRVEDLREKPVASDLSRAALAQIDTGLTSATSHAKHRDYVEALNLLRLTGPDVIRLGAELSRLETAKTEAEADLAKLEERIAKVTADCTAFPELSPRLSKVAAVPAGIRRAIDGNFFPEAKSQSASAEQELDAILAELKRLEAELAAKVARKAAERKDWEAARPRHERLKTQADELEAWQSPDAAAPKGHLRDIAGHVEAEAYATALTTLQSAEAAILQPWSRHEAQVVARTDYEQARPPLDTRAEEVGRPPNVDDDVAAKLKAAQTLLDGMTEKAKAMDFVAAGDGIAGAKQALDLAEQAKREARIRAEEAARLGLDPNTSDPALHEAVKRRVYEEELEVFLTRLLLADEACRADPMGSEVDTAMAQLRTDRASIEGTAGGGDYVTAVEDLRRATKQLGAIEEMMRRQQALKERYVAALAPVKADAARLAASDLRKVAAAAATVMGGLEKAEKLASGGDYGAALTAVQALSNEVQDTQQLSDDLTSKKRAVDERLAALDHRIAAARKNEFAEIQPGADAVITHADALARMVEAEDFDGALKALDDLEKLVTDYEAEAERARLHQRYTDALATFDIVARLPVRPLLLPETETAAAAALAKDAERSGHDARGDWGPAWDAVNAEADLLDAYEAEVKAIEAAQKLYEAAVAELVKKADGLVTDAKACEDDTGTLAPAMAAMAEARKQMEAAATAKKYREALTLLDAFRKTVTEAEKVIEGLLQAPEGKIDGFLQSEAATAAGAVINALLHAINQFRVFVLNEITKERPGRAGIRRTTYVLDVAAAIASAVPGGALFAVGLTSFKVGLTVGADEMDAYLDGKDEEQANQVIAKMMTEAKAYEAKFDTKITPRFKAKYPDAYRKIGNLLYHGNDSAAKEVARSNGIPSGAGLVTLSQTFYADLVSQFNSR